MPSPTKRENSNSQRPRLEWVRAGDLDANPANWRRHPDKQMRALKDAIADPEIGWAGVLLYNERTQRLIDGHARKDSVAPDTLVPVLMGSWSESAERKILLTLDPLAGMAEADGEALQALMSDVDLDDDNWAGVGEALQAELDAAFGDEQGPDPSGSDPSAPPEPPDDPITQRGDIWVLGDHRLMCGDSGSVEDLDRLLDGNTIDLVNMDPPYNVKVEPRSSTAMAAGLSSFQNKKAQLHHRGFDQARGVTDPKKARQKMRAKDRPLENDFVTDEAFDELLLAWFGNASRVLKPGGSFYIWGGYANIGNYPGPLEAAGLYFSQGIVWDKEHPVLTRKDFMGAFEIAFYGWKKGAGHHFYGPNNATDLWHVKKVNPQAMVHLTEKPVELAVRSIQYSSKPGENVLDLFGGSGSTLIGCEQTGRRGYLMEMDPAYCDVIVQRWEQFTGDKATRATE